MPPKNATHEQLESTSSRPILDPTTSGPQKPAKEHAGKTALQGQQDKIDGTGAQEAEKHIRISPIEKTDPEREHKSIGQVGGA